MSNTLLYQVYALQGLSPTDQSILNVLAFSAAKDSNFVNINMETIIQRTKFADRTIRYSLRRLEKLGYLVNMGEKGRGHILKYTVAPVSKKDVEEIPVAPVSVVPPEEIPPTNGHKPPKLPDRKNGLSAYRDPLARRPDETAMEYARRVDRR